MEKILILLRQELIDLKGWFSSFFKQQKELKNSIDDLSQVIIKQKPPIVNVAAPIVNVPEIKIPNIIIPEIKVPEQKEIKIPKIEIPKIVIPEIKIPDIKLPEIKIPQIKVPKPEVTVNVPPIKIPDLQWPKDKMPIEGWVQLMGVSLSNPLPVQIRDANGKPIDFGGSFTQVTGGGGGGGGGFVKVKNKSNEQINPATEDTLLGVKTAVEATNITGIGHGVKTITVAGTDEALAGSTACKRAIIQSQTDNTGLIAVGTSGVDATEATGTGIILYSGDALELDIDNLVDIYIDATVSGEGVRYTYFT